MSLPLRGAWIEISVLGIKRASFYVAPHGGAWIETQVLPALGAWWCVAPYAGSVD